jgi:predicted dehydrogenase
MCDDLRRDNQDSQDNQNSQDNQDQTFKICLIGCGDMARKGHGPALARFATQNSQVELAGCCDINPDRAASFARLFGFHRFYTDWREMLQQEKPAGVSLVVPVDRTAVMAQEILAMGIPLLLEKPPGLNDAEAKDLMKAAQASGTPNRVAFNRRYMPLVQSFIKQIDPAKPILEVHCDFQRFRRYDHDFATTAIHGIDLVSYLAGAYLTVAYTYMHLPALGDEVAHYHLQAQLAGGTLASLFFRPAAGVIYERYQVIQAGRTGLLHLPVWNNPDSPGLAVWYDQGVKTWEEKGTEDPFDVINGFYAETAEFYTQIMRMNQIVPVDANGRRKYSACRPMWPAGDLENSCDAVRVAEALRQRIKFLKFHE